MSKRHLSVVLAVLLVAGGAVGFLVWNGTLRFGGDAGPGGDPHAGKKPETEMVKVGDLALSGPFTHDNLTITLIHGEDRFQGRDCLLLSEALEQKKFVIHETQNVNDLAMENLSDVDVIIFSGDILKGGQQDRIAQHDQIVPPHSGKVPLNVFCVEHTAPRWMGKLEGKTTEFQGCPATVCSNSLRLANRMKSNQGEVWKEVANAQASLSKNAKADVRAKESDSSLALSMDAKELKAATEACIAKLDKLLDGKDDVVGFAVAVNGKVMNVDVYGSPALFRKVFGRLVRASALEAFAEQEKDKKFTEPTLAEFRTFMEEAARGTVTAEEQKTGLCATKNEASRVVGFTTSDPAKAKSVLRTNYLAY